jgi:hypothetical protein
MQKMSNLKRRCNNADDVILTTNFWINLCYNNNNNNNNLIVGYEYHVSIIGQMLDNCLDLNKTIY